MRYVELVEAGRGSGEAAQNQLANVEALDIAQSLASFLIHLSDPTVAGAVLPAHATF